MSTGSSQKGALKEFWGKEVKGKEKSHFFERRHFHMSPFKKMLLWDKSFPEKATFPYVAFSGKCRF